MRQPVRAFAIGLFTAGIIMLIGIFYYDDSNKSADDLSVDELTSSLKEQGYRVVTEDEYIAVSVNNDKTNKKTNTTEKSGEDQEKDKQGLNKDDKDKEKKTSEKEDNKDDTENKDDKQDKKDAVKKYTINIESGVLSSEISEKLAANDIIDDATKFNLYLTDNDYGEKIQLGKFKVNSDMNFKELAEAISK